MSRFTLLRLVSVKNPPTQLTHDGWFSIAVDLVSSILYFVLGRNFFFLGSLCPLHSCFDSIFNLSCLRISITFHGLFVTLIPLRVRHREKGLRAEKFPYSLKLFRHHVLLRSCEHHCRGRKVFWCLAFRVGHCIILGSPSILFAD